MTQSLAEQLVRAAIEMPTTSVPDEALREAVTRIVDTVGVALAGIETPSGTASARMALGEAKRWGATGGASVWGTGRRAPAALAALANGTSAHALDYDDADVQTIMHPGAIVIPAALALAEENGASGLDVLAAIVAGYQVAHILGDLAANVPERRLHSRGFQPTPILGIIAGAIVIGRLLGAPAEKIVNAIGICSGMASGLLEFLKSGGETKQLQVGWASHGAFLGFALAQAGATGPRASLEGQYGIFQAFGQQPAREPGGSGIAFWEEPSILRIETKFYPACFSVHSFADAWKAIRADLIARGADPVKDIAEIHCVVPPLSAQYVFDPIEIKYHPSTAHQARFSMPYCLAEIALHGKLNLESFTDAHIHDPNAHEFAHKVSYEVSEGDSQGVITVRSADGSVITQDVRSKRREVGKETRQEVREKFMDTARNTAPAEVLEETLASIADIYEKDTVAPFFSMLSKLSFPGV